MKLINDIKQFWFAPIPPERLAILRIATGCFSLWYLLDRFEMLQKVAASGLENFKPIGLLYWMEKPLSAEVFWWISMIVILFNILYILGWKFKITGPIFGILMLCFFTYRNSWSMIYHNRNGVILHILILGLVASADAISLDANNRKKRGKKAFKANWQYGWPVKLICLATACTYFLSGVAKLAGDLALAWANGSAMRAQVAVDAIRKSLLGAETAPLFDFIYEQTWLFFIMGTLTFVLELGAPFALIRKRIVIAWVALTWMMHWGIFFIMGITFHYQMSGLIFLSFFASEQIWFKLKHKLQQKQEKLVASNRPIVLFDGICNLCNASVRFVMERDTNRKFTFASLQSEIGRKLLDKYQLPQNMSSIILISDNKAYQKSDAVLRISKQLYFPWNLGIAFLIIPRVVRNYVYNFVAVNRYRWFGKQASCSLIPAQEKTRFLDLQ
ncbi:MAG: DCC1-like thiol-disulfide oxidoreductase family protein [Bacteroidota bacterium]